MKRRRLIGAAATAWGASALAGCGLFDGDSGPPPPPDALQPVLDEALRLAAGYDRAVVAEPGLADRLTPLADDHRAHAAELAKVIGATLPSVAPSASAGSGEAEQSVKALRKAEQAAHKTAAAACRVAPGVRAGLVGSIAAARAAHAEALR
ncbi:MAG: hypothetical protein ABW000_10125 [Actinoplanes sp.]